MALIFGDYIDPVDHVEHLHIHFSPTAMPLQQRWRNNGLSADFLGEYWATFFPAHNLPAENRRESIKGAVAYIANELLENVMKFSYEPANYAVSLGLYLYENEFRFYTVNAVDPHKLDVFQDRIQSLLEEDPAELYLRQIERNALEGNGSASHLGLLTMLHDYGARLAWKFEHVDEVDEGVALMIVHTMVRLEI